MGEEQQFGKRFNVVIFGSAKLSRVGPQVDPLSLICILTMSFGVGLGIFGPNVRIFEAMRNWPTVS